MSESQLIFLLRDPNVLIYRMEVKRKTPWMAVKKNRQKATLSASQLLLERAIQYRLLKTNKQKTVFQNSVYVCGVPRGTGGEVLAIQSFIPKGSGTDGLIEL